MPSGTPEPSIRKTRRSALCARSLARPMPSFSITSSVWRSPAVSSMVTASPFSSILTSMTSLVVPGISEVSAASLPANALIKVDFPLFGGPTIATSNPSRTLSAIRAPALSARKSVNREHSISRTSGATSTGTSSSAKSIVASSNAAARISFARQTSARCPMAPDKTRSACFRCTSVSASIKSANPSTCARSRRSFSRARRVNSPGSAGRSPGNTDSAFRIARVTAVLP